MLTVGNIQELLYAWAPESLAWEKDNTGLIVGSPHDEARGILIAVDLSLPVIEEALRVGATLIVTHHPPMFRAVRSIRSDSGEGRMITELLRRGVSLIAMHTNADAASRGINSALAGKLGLRNVAPLTAAAGLQRRIEIVVHRYREHERHLRRIAESAGASFFLLEDEEGRGIAVLNGPVSSMGRLSSVIREKIGGDIVRVSTIRTDDMTNECGTGAIGDLEERMSAEDFLKKVKNILGCSVLKTSRFRSDLCVGKVAICGGAGASYIASAVGSGADAYVTGDLTYHFFHEHGGDILLVDAGHYETENVFKEICASALREALFESSAKINIFEASNDTNAILTIT